MSHEPHPREGLVSFVSRAAGIRGLSLSGFCNELGLSTKKLINLDHLQTNAIAEIFGIHNSALTEMLSWSPQPSPSVQVQFRGEDFVSRALINPIVRGCPACLREDIQSGAVPPRGQMAMRGDWQLRYVDMCLQHRQALVPLWNIAQTLARYDFSTRLHSIADDIVAERLDQPCKPITSYDQWLDDRLSFGTDLSWLATHAIDTAARFCLLLGAEMERLIPESSSRSRPPREVGFECARKGPEALTKTFDDLASSVKGSQYSPQRAFGRLYVWLTWDMANDPRCDPYRDLMREVIFNNWAIPAGEPILGKSLTTPRLYSVLTAAKEIGKSTHFTRRFLEQKGVIDPVDDRTDAGLTFDATSANPILAQAKRLVVAKEMRKRLGVSPHQFETFIRQKILSPVLPQSVANLQWDTADADALLEELAKHAVTVDADDTDWLPLGLAAGRARVDVKDAIDAARRGLVQVGRQPGLIGYASVYVRQSQIEKLRAKGPKHITLSAFARDVGLHQSGEMTDLFNAGHVTATELFNPETRRKGLYVTDADIAAFHAKFTTLKLLSMREKTDGRALAPRLRDAGISRFAPEGQDFGPVYLLDDVLGALW
ncbi:TniQ family protein [Pseudosulfitobacter koreensis]|uniref:TniQ family protein n=1 Tax=Pseudosulfitobacter koreensis TaxID=2968472 RepID=A0ABT1YWJ8_9RHOB|nr:TniQ family protein [Pseudosulfitobacter koreense]